MINYFEEIIQENLEISVRNRNDGLCLFLVKHMFLFKHGILILLHVLHSNF